jgi:hypothetical protein
MLTEGLALRRTAIFDVIHNCFDSKLLNKHGMFSQKTELLQSEDAHVNSYSGKIEISTKIQKIWKLSLLERQQQQGLAHMIWHKVSD